MKVVLICHAEDHINREGIARWLGAECDLAGIVAIRETGSPLRRRVRAELRRSGFLGLLDVFAFRLHYRLFQSGRDHAWENGTLGTLADRYPPLPESLPVHETPSPNRPETIAFLRSVAPDLVIARCKVILKPAVFETPTHGTYVMHPGICPEYRNAHGCFWALANGDSENVGMTLLRVDWGIDTGPVFGYFRYPHDALGESHRVIQERVVLDNLDAIAARLREIASGNARPLDTTGRPSKVWGQPRLTAYFKLRRHARR